MTRRTFFGVTVTGMLSTTACVIDTDAGPTLTASKTLEEGKVESIKAEIRIGVGEVRVTGGGSKLLDAKFEYSERLGQPEVRYDGEGFRGRLSITAPKERKIAGDMKNVWNLKFGNKAPMELEVHLGVGESHFDLSEVPLRRVEMHVGVGEVDLTLGGKHSADLEVQVRGGVGEARIKLPKNFGVVADAKGGLGSIDVKGLTKRGDRYYNDAYKEGQPAIRLDVRGGVGEIQLTVAE